MDVHTLTDKEISTLMPTLTATQLATLCDALDRKVCGFCADPEVVANGYCIKHLA